MGADLAAGASVGGYRIERVVGRGGMGVVYCATQLALERRVALKVIAPALADKETFRERFRRESQLAAAIDHPNVVPIYEAGEAGGLLFLAMRYVEGESLAAMLYREGRLAPSQAAELLGQVAFALDAAHGLGLVHRDVKPANVLVEAGAQAYLTDFGLVRRVASGGSVTRSGQWLGTLSYAAPEQIQGDRVDGRADVYALGCVLFHCLCGQVPFVRDNDMARMWAHAADPPPVPSSLVPGLPPAFDDVIARALAKEPAERQGSAGELGREIAAAAAGQPFEREPPVAATQVIMGTPAGGSPAGDPPARDPAPERRGRRLRLLAAAVVVAVVAALLAATQLLSDGGEDAAKRRAADAQKAQKAQQAAADKRRRDQEARRRQRERRIEAEREPQQTTTQPAPPTTAPEASGSPPAENSDKGSGQGSPRAENSDKGSGQGSPRAGPTVSRSAAAGAAERAANDYARGVGLPAASWSPSCSQSGDSWSCRVSSQGPGEPSGAGYPCSGTVVVAAEGSPTVRSRSISCSE